MLSPVPTQRRILAFWLPLAASWLLMSAEGPILQAVIARLPGLETQIAAFGIVMSVEITVESPVIMLLATSTALVGGRRSFQVVRRFMLGANLLATSAAALVAFTPLFDLLVRGVMGIPAPIACAARPGMQIMTFWSAAIGWRRFYQGVLIRHGRTGPIAWGTLLRLLGSAGTGIALALTTHFSGVSIAAAGLMAGVLLEAFFATVAARPTVSALQSVVESHGTGGVTARDVLGYHAPLAATSFLTLLAQPMVAASLARMPAAEESLAAWPVVWGLLFVFRSPAFALPEVVIALVRRPAAAQPVRRFCRGVGLASSAALAAVAATPLAVLYLRHLVALPDRLAGFVIPGLLIGVLLPFLNAWHSWFRGALMASRATSAIYWGMGLNLSVMAAAVGLGVRLRAPGVATAVAALILAIVAEIGYLRRRAAAQVGGGGVL